MPRQAGLGKVHRHDTVEDLPATLTPHAPPPGTIARDRAAVWLETEQCFCIGLSGNTCKQGSAKVRAQVATNTGKLRPPEFF